MRLPWRSRHSAAKLSTRSIVSAALSRSKGVSLGRLSLCFVRPTGTIETLYTPGYSSDSSRIERLSCSPSL